MWEASAKVVWGPAFIGFIICSSLYGVTLAQSIFYYRTFRVDPKYIKVLVAVLFVLDTLHVYYLSATFWVVCIRGRLDISGLTVLPWQTPASILMTVLIAFIVQSFFALRVWRISRNRVLTGIIMAFTFISFGFGIAYVRNMFLIREEATNPGKLIAVNVELASGVICDIVITGSLVYYLRSRRTGYGRTESILQTLILYTVNMGMFGCVVAFAAFFLAVYRIPEHFPKSVAPQFFLSKCYVNSLLAILNTRVRIRELFNQTMEIYVPTIRSSIELESRLKSEDFPEDNYCEYFPEGYLDQLGSEV